VLEVGFTGRLNIVSLDVEGRASEGSVFEVRYYILTIVSGDKANIMSGTSILVQSTYIIASTANCNVEIGGA